VTAHTVTAGVTLHRQLVQERATGLAVEKDEVRSWLSCMAAPVPDALVRFVAAVAISMPDQHPFVSMSQISPSTFGVPKPVT
jgi:DNA-binding IclR family transcriptional regulator